jgi:hypothetical protein
MTPTEQVPSLLDWLKAKWSQPRTQRLFRFTLASLSALWGVYMLSASGAKSPAGGYFLLGLALGFLFWGLTTRGGVIPTPNLPEFSLARAAPAAPEGALESVSAPPVARRISPAAILTLAPSLRLPGALLLAVIGQFIITGNRQNYAWGLFFYACGLAAFVWIVWKDKLLPAPRAEAHIEARPIPFRLWPLTVTVVATLVAFVGAGGNRFRPFGVVAWAVAVGAWLAAMWETPLLTLVDGWWANVRARWQEGLFNFRLTRTAILLLGVLAVGAFYRYYELASVPPEMTSDHVEKLLDVGEILDGTPYIFFERNTGREPLQFYAAVLVIKLLGTGLTHLTLKIVTATAGLLTLPFIFWLGRELEDEAFGLLAALLTAVSYWAVALSRVGLRFPLTPLFVAPVLFFLLRGVRRGARNDFLLAGLCLGAGLNGYSTFRVTPALALVGAAWFALWAQNRENRARLFTHTALLFVTMFLGFLPLFRFLTDRSDLFWARMFSRMSDAEQAVQGSPLLVFLSNQWRAALFFNYESERGAWANTILNIPALDVITGALFVLGLAFVIARAVVRRDKVAGFLLIALPVLMLPSTLSLAFPEENPSFVRLGSAIPVVMTLAAYPLWLILKQFQTLLPARSAAWAKAAALGVIVGGAAAFTYNLYFVEYYQQYRLAAQNASEIGAVIRAFAESIGAYDTAAVRPYPHWADTRAVGMYAGDFWRDFAIQEADLGRYQGDPRPKLFVLHKNDFTARPDGQQPSVPLLRQLYPTGALSVYHSKIPFHDFLIYFVPGTEDLDENTLPPP